MPPRKKMNTKRWSVSTSAKAIVGETVFHSAAPLLPSRPLLRLAIDLSPLKIWAGERQTERLLSRGRARNLGLELRRCEITQALVEIQDRLRYLVGMFGGNGERPFHALQHGIGA